MVLDYDANVGFISTALRSSWTVVPHVCSRFEFWIFMAVHGSVVYSYHRGWLAGADNRHSPLFLDWRLVRIISGITTFFLVFFTMTTYKRYLNVYDKIRDLLSIVCGFCFQATVTFEKSQVHLHLAARYFLISMVLFFFELENLHDPHYEVPDEVWQELIQKNLILESESKVLSKYHRHQRSLVMLHWAAKVIRLGQRVSAEQGVKPPANEVADMISTLVHVHALQQIIADIMKLPVPFQYFHIMVSMVMTNIFFWAYIMGTTSSIFAPFCFFVASLCFLGMLELAMALTNPFGDDPTDFPLTFWLVAVIEDALILTPMDEHVYLGEPDKFKSHASRECKLTWRSREVHRSLTEMLHPSQFDAASDDDEHYTSDIADDL
jgi:predicted membrane chloride channel (bestrophin family)